MLAPQSAVISLFKMSKVIGLYDSYIGMMVITGAFRIPSATFLIMTFYKDISVSLMNLHLSMGQKRQVFWKIIMPLSKPIIASCAIVSFRAVWNELMFANVLLESTVKKNYSGWTCESSRDNYYKLDNVNGWNGHCLSSAGYYFLILQKQFIRGLTAGGVKG